MPRNAIPGFDEALAQERRERNVPYLSDFYENDLCGTRVRNLTPILYVRLVESRTPFIAGGDAGLEHVAQFVYIASGLEISDSTERQKSIREIATRAGEIGLEDCFAQIDEYVDVTFRDSPEEGGGSSPIASSCAWMEYRFACDPWRWDRDRTLNMPIRILYQQIRCQEKEHGEAVANKLSRAAYKGFIEALQAGINDGSITQSDLDKIREANIKNG